MRRLFGLVAAAAFVVSLAAPMTAGTMSVDADTIRGEVVDVACGLKGRSGDDHANCAMACAKKGMPVGVLTDDAIYVITGDYAADNNAKLLDFVAKTVEVTGDVTEEDGQKRINVTSIKLAQ